MPGIKEIRTKIKSVQNTRKITKAMEMVAASKMRKAQDRMQQARPYGDKIRNIVAHLSQANPEYRHPFIVKRPVKGVGIICVTTDKGLCGGLNTNILRALLAKYRELNDAGVEVQATAIGNKGLGFLQRIGANVVSQVVQLGDTPHLESLVGPVKVQLDAYGEGRIDRLFLAYSRFINTMKQEPVIEQLLPLSDEKLLLGEDYYSFVKGTESDAAAAKVLPGGNGEARARAEARTHGWDYLYEPDPQQVIDELMTRYVEALIYQAVAENMSSEQSARMVAMKSASDNAKKVIDELQLIYNKTRQAAITKEIAEIVGGAAAV